jgi:uncharacterized DUF497 family protein
MRFEWNEAKNRANILKHGFHFAEAEEMFRGVLLVRPDTSEDYGEERWLGIGMIHGGVAFVAFTESAEDVTRIISLRRANHEESKEYETAVQDGLETN